MKDALNKTIGICRLIFGYGIMLTLFAGGLTFFAYLVALVIGGDTATAICTFTYKQFIPVIVYITTCLILFGLVIMYFAGEKALTVGRKKASSEEGEK